MKKVFFTLIITIIFLQGIQVFLSNTIASGSIEAAQVQEKIATLDSQNAVLKTELLNYASLTRVSSRAAELGFIDTRSFMMVNSPLSVAASTRIANP